MERYLKDTQLYWQLKNKYETKYTNVKSKIIKENKKSSFSELIKEIQRHCVNCGKKVELFLHKIPITCMHLVTVLKNVN